MTQGIGVLKLLAKTRLSSFIALGEPRAASAMASRVYERIITLIILAPSCLILSEIESRRFIMAYRLSLEFEVRRYEL